MGIAVKKSEHREKVAEYHGEKATLYFEPWYFAT
jgi:hypothetical protein